MAMNAKNTSSMAPTLAASFRPSVVPLAMASRKLLPTRSMLMSMRWSTGSVWGYSTLATTTAPGAAMTLAVSRCLAKNRR